MYQISHTITYEYSQPVIFAPHILRLCPQTNNQQSIQQYLLNILPLPLARSEVRDLDGNNMLKVWFDQVPSQTLQVQSQVQAVSYLQNPFDYLLEPWAMTLPIDYPTLLKQRLQPYLGGYLTNSIDPIAAQLGAEIWAEHSSVTQFLTALNQRIYHTCKYLLRPHGLPWPPGVTWTKQVGSCRDLTVLFMEVCRSVGLAARFVSGYEAGGEATERYLHAWAEVYLPGAGWRGYDPTHGLVVTDDHIVVAVAPQQQQTMPIEGALRGQAVEAQVSEQLLIQKT
jgi:transglutaminase-like putative cysteine protease